MSDVLTPAESMMMRETFRVTMIRAADILSRLGESDVLDAQKALLQQGCTLQQVAKVDRALIGEMHLRACAENLANDESRRVSYMTRRLKLSVQPVEGGVR